MSCDPTTVTVGAPILTLQEEVRFLDAGTPGSGPENMRVDEELLARAERLPGPLTWIRFYRWDRPTVSLGRNQQPEAAVDLGECRELDVPVVHRPTGGRAVLHGDELTYAVVSNSPRLIGRGIAASSGLISQALAGGLQRLGLTAARVSEGTVLRRPRGGRVPPCFVSHSRSELTWNGRKIAGSAQRRLCHAFLQHGSLPLTIDFDLMARVFGTPRQILQASFCSLTEACGRRPTFEEVRDSLTEGFCQVLGIDGQGFRHSTPLDLEVSPQPTAAGGM